MARFSIEEFEKLSKGKEENNNKVKFFSLKNDKDEAIVRFMYSDKSQIEIDTIHTLKVGDSFTKISCLRNAYEPLSNCPLCQNKDKVSYKFFVKLVKYVRDDNGNLEVIPCVWERPASFKQTLNTWLEEYGDLSNYIFKIKRNGKAGDTKTTYAIIPTSTQIYQPDVYVKDFSGFDGYTVENNAYRVKTFDELVNFVNTNTFDNSTTNSQNNVKKENNFGVEEEVAQVYSNPSSLNDFSTRSPQRPNTNREVDITQHTSEVRPKRYTYN